MENPTPRRALCEICSLLFGRGLVSGADGNVSLRAREGGMYITPSGVGKGSLEEEQILRQGFDGTVLEGSLRPTKEAGFHAMLYRRKPEVGAVIHTHPPAATAFAACGLSLPRDVLIEVPLLLGEIGLAPYARPGSRELVDALEALADRHDVFFLQNHGVIVCGDTVRQAFDRMDALENAAKTILYTRLLGGAAPIPAEELEKLRAQ